MDETPTYMKRIWIAEAPAGVWASGAHVIYDWGNGAKEPLPVQEWRDMGWNVIGPYVLENNGSGNASEKSHPLLMSTAAIIRELARLVGMNEGAMDEYGRDRVRILKQEAERRAQLLDERYGH